MAYTLPTNKIDPSLVGDAYHLALGTTTPGLGSPDRIFGYLMAEGSKFEQDTDIKTRDLITQNASPNLIDRDITNTPRVTDGDFSGGAFQINWIDTTRFWDSDLDSGTAGYLILQPQWLRKSVATGGAGTADAIISWNNDIYGIIGGDMPAASYYRMSDLSFFAPGIAARFIDTDGESLFLGDGINTIKSTKDNAVFTTVINTLPNFSNMWVVNEGTAGRFIYYTTNNTDLYKVDLATGTGAIVVPTGGARIYIRDLIAYEAGVAIVTNDIAGTGSDVWYHDGSTLSRLIRINQFILAGVTVALGQIYVTGQSQAASQPPVLIRIGGGSFEIVGRFGTPLVNLTYTTSIGQPISSGQYVYFVLTTPVFNGISAANYIGVYDTATGAVSHLPNMDLTDAPQGGLRQIACSGKSVAFVMRIASGGGGAPYSIYIQYQSNSNRWGGTPKWQPSGSLIGSRLDFNTPGLEKLFRRLLVHHTPLKAGEQIQINAYVDTDPAAISGATPTPTGTVTNNQVGSDTTVLVLPQRTIGYCMVFSVKLTAGTGQLTTPSIYYVATEVTVSWTWKFQLDCSSRRRMLNGQEDNQGLRAKDLVMMIQQAWELASKITFYHPNGNTYTVVIETAHFESENPLNLVTPEHSADLEGLWTVTLRDAVL